MSKPSKRMIVNQESVDCNRRYSLEEAISLLKKASNAKFNETIDISVNLGIDAKKSEQNGLSIEHPSRSRNGPL